MTLTALQAVIGRFRQQPANQRAEQWAVNPLLPGAEYTQYWQKHHRRRESTVTHSTGQRSLSRTVGEARSGGPVRRPGQEVQSGGPVRRNVRDNFREYFKIKVRIRSGVSFLFCHSSSDWRRTSGSLSISLIIYWWTYWSFSPENIRIGKNVSTATSAWSAEQLINKTVLLLTDSYFQM